MRQANLFVILDTVPYSKNSYINRVKIKDGKWLTLPIRQDFNQIIRDVRLCDIKDTAKQIEIIKETYKDAPYFERYYNTFYHRMELPWKFLSTLNTALILVIQRLLKIDTSITQSSQFDFKGTGNDLLIEICQKFKANIYLSGQGGRNYLDEKKFNDAGIEVRYVENDYKDISILDYLFNYGSSALDAAEN